MELLLVGDVGDAGERARSLCEECGWHTTITPLRSSMEGGGVVSLEHVSAGRGDGWQVVAQGGTARVFGTIEEALTHLNETLLQPQISAPSAGALVPSLDLFEGCLVGIAVGDMVGLGVESFPMPACKMYVERLRPAGGLSQTMEPWGLRVRAAERAGQGEEYWATHTKYPFGQISDDTQCSRELATSIISAQRFSVAVRGGSAIHGAPACPRRIHRRDTTHKGRAWGGARSAPPHDPDVGTQLHTRNAEGAALALALTPPHLKGTIACWGGRRAD
jgi:hypothetical protein